VRAIVLHRTGGPEVLELEDVPAPSPKAGEVLVELHARGVGFADTERRSAKYGPTPVPCILGSEGAGVTDRCTFTLGDFLEVSGEEKFDYAIVMGFMDYIEDAGALMRKVLGVCRGKAFFSFPADGGPLAWQRRLRYRSRCALYMYTESQIRSLVSALGVKSSSIEPISRDFFVTLTV